MTRKIEEPETLDDASLDTASGGRTLLSTPDKTEPIGMFPPGVGELKPRPASPPPIPYPNPSPSTD